VSATRHRVETGGGSSADGSSRPPFYRVSVDDVRGTEVEPVECDHARRRSRSIECVVPRKPAY